MQQAYWRKRGSLPVENSVRNIKFCVFAASLQMPRLRQYARRWLQVWDSAVLNRAKNTLRQREARHSWSR